MVDLSEEGWRKAIDAYRESIAEYKEYQEPARPELLNDAIENLYSVFSRYSSWSKNPIELKENNSEAMLTKKMRDLSAEDLYDFVSSVLLTWGDENDFRHFLPRMLELCTESRRFHPELVFGRLRYASWQKWNADERLVIEQFAAAWFDSTLAHFPCRAEMHIVLCSIACLYDNVEFYLKRWAETKSPAAFQHFVQSYRRIEDPGFVPRDQAQIMKNWVACAKTADWLENGYLEFCDEPWANELAEAIDVVELNSVYLKAKNGFRDEQ